MKISQNITWWHAVTELISFVDLLPDGFSTRTIWPYTMRALAVNALTIKRQISSFRDFCKVGLDVTDMATKTPQFVFTLPLPGHDTKWMNCKKYKNSPIFVKKKFTCFR